MIRGFFLIILDTATTSVQLVAVSECSKSLFWVQLAYFRGTQWVNHVIGADFFAGCIPLFKLFLAAIAPTFFCAGLFTLRGHRP